MFYILFLLQFSLILGRLVDLEKMSPNQRELREVRKDVFCQNPISKASVDFPDKIIGRASIDFKMFSGYVNVTTNDWLFYWFFSTRDQNPSAPLIIWTNGGPGCTAMEGATTENSPLWLLNIKESCSSSKCDYSNQFSKNSYAWNSRANLLYLDQPRNVGYSFGSGSVYSSVEAAQDFIVFYNNWLVLFPEFVGRKVIIAGESYGGRYVPAWAAAILNFNKANPEKQINFGGVLIGNGLIDSSVQTTKTFVEFQHSANLIPVNDNPTLEAKARSDMTAYIGYEPNYYDYRLQSIKCTQGCYGYNYSAWAAWMLQTEVMTALNVCGDAGRDAFTGSAGGCINMPAGFDSKAFDYPGALAAALAAGVPVTLYYGKQDTACDYKGGLALANSLKWSGQQAFQSAELLPLTAGSIPIGQMKSYQGLKFMQIDNAGHMVPLDQPLAALLALNTLLDDTTNGKK